MDIAKKILTEIELKEKSVEELHRSLDELTNLELEEADKRTKLMNSDLTKVIDGKITEKAKVAYCDSQLKKETEQIAWLKNDVSKLKKYIELHDDKISCYKYMIRELEL